MLIGMHLRALGDVHNHDVVCFTILVRAIHNFSSNSNGRLAIIIPNTADVIDMLDIVVNAADLTVVLNADCQYSTVSICEIHKMIGKRLGILPSALSVKCLALFL